MYLTNRVGILLSSKLSCCSNQKMDSSFALPEGITSYVWDALLYIYFFYIFGSLGESPVIVDQHVPY